jgi:hypothetical protein
MIYHVASSRYEENDFIMNLLPRILRQIIISRSHRVFFLLTYDNGFFADARWERVIHLLNLYHRSLYGVPLSGYYTEIYDDTVFDFCAAAQKKPREWYGENKMTIDEMREVFAFVRQYNYPLFKDFYECNLRSLGGKL